MQEGCPHHPALPLFLLSGCFETPRVTWSQLWTCDLSRRRGCCGCIPKSCHGIPGPTHSRVRGCSWSWAGKTTDGRKGNWARRILQIESESLWASLPSPTLRGTEPGQRLPQPDVPVIPDEASISAKTGAEGDSPDLSTYFLLPCKHTLPPSLPPWVPVPSHADQS